MRRRSSDTTPETKTPVGADRPTAPATMPPSVTKPTAATTVVNNITVNAPPGTKQEDVKQVVTKALYDVLEGAASMEPEDLVPTAPPSIRLEMPVGFERIVTHQFSVLDDSQLEQEYLFLRSQLTFGAERASCKGYGELQNALDAAEENVQRAAELYARYTVAHAVFENNALVVGSSLRDSAKDALEQRKLSLKEKTGAAGKAITNADTEAEIAAQFPDEAVALVEKRTTAKMSLKLVGDLKEQLAARAWDLRTMVNRSRQEE